MSTATLNGITIGYDDTGGDEPLLLVHGHPFDRTMWHPQLALGYRMIAPDLRGYGESTVVPGKTAFDVFAADLAALLDHLKVDRAVLVGLSMGGQIVLEFLRLYPDRVRALVLADTSPRQRDGRGRAVSHRAGGHIAPRWQRRLHRGVAAEDGGAGLRR